MVWSPQLLWGDEREAVSDASRFFDDDREPSPFIANILHSCE